MLGETSSRAFRFGETLGVERFDIYSTDESGSLNKSLKLWVAGESCRSQVSVFRRHQKAI